MGIPSGREEDESLVVSYSSEEGAFARVHVNGAIPARTNQPADSKCRDKVSSHLIYT